MQAQRAHEMAQPGWPDLTPSRPLPQVADGAAAIPSPALRLRDELAARLAALSTAERSVAIHEPKWPVPARLALIVGLSLTGWTAIGATAFWMS